MFDSSPPEEGLPHLEQRADPGTSTSRPQERDWIFVPASVAASYWTWVILSNAAA
jgi:hypothetical protein